MSELQQIAILTAVSVIAGYANILYNISKGKEINITNGLIQIFLSVFVGVVAGMIAGNYLSSELTYATVSVSAFIATKILEVLDNQTTTGIGEFIKKIIYDKLKIDDTDKKK